MAVSSLFLAAPAPAATTTVGANPCAARSFTTVFGPFGDRSLYTLAPDGDFEAGANGWSLAGAANVAAGSSSIKLGNPLGAKSLQLAPGASATTPPICVERGFSSFRFVARSTGAALGTVNAEVLYSSGAKTPAVPRKTSAGWAAAGQTSLAQGQFQVASFASTSVRIRFTASGGTVRVDDVYVDPRYRG